MIETRFEDDLVEVSGGGGYLMLCAGRKQLLRDGTGPMPLDAIAGFDAAEGAIVIRPVTGDRERCEFEGATISELAPIAGRLNVNLSAWR